MTGQRLLLFQIPLAGASGGGVSLVRGSEILGLNARYQIQSGGQSVNEHKRVSRYRSRTLQPQYHSVNPDVVIPSSIKPMLSTIRRRPFRILNTSLICILRSLLP